MGAAGKLLLAPGLLLVRLLRCLHQQHQDFGVLQEIEGLV